MTFSLPLSGWALVGFAASPIALEETQVVQLENNAVVLQAIASQQVVYLAETHDDAADHAAQLAIVQAMNAENEIAIALEMFQRPFQPVLEAYLAGEITEAELVAQSEYETRWGYDWELYAPIVRYAKVNGIPLIALNTPAEVTRKVAKEGLESLMDEDLVHIPPVADIDTTDENYRALISETFDAHGGAGHSISFDNFFAAQVLWDETMAERVVQQLAAEPERQVIVLAGEGHVNNDYGIPNRVMRRSPEVTQASVRLLPIEEVNGSETNELTDFVWITQQHEL
ncbi:MAG: ChaN family lipoprotein [Phormidesmis sp.]